jgi:uncharacterized protein (TIGR02268 family)
MLSLAPLVMLALLQDAAVPLAQECEAHRRLELSRVESTRQLEVCVGAARVTSFLFDAPVVVDLQDETRFGEVTRGRTSIHVMPSGEMLPGERLRLTAHLGTGEAREDVTLTLVVHADRSTHQVDVYRDPRSRESLREELLRERTTRLALEEEFEQLRVSARQAGSMLTLVASGALRLKGIRVSEEIEWPVGYEENQLFITRCIRYRSATSVAAEVWLRNLGAQPWTMVGASLTNPGGPLRDVRWREEPIAPNTVGHIVVEAAMGSERQPPEGVTLSLWEQGTRVIHIPEVTFPE